MSARVLVVDDSPTVLKLIESQLAAEYFSVVCADTGAKALEICETDNIDVVLLDVLMPDMDGRDVCIKLKANPETAHIPVIMVTQLNAVKDRIEGLEAGADEFLSKPIDKTQLMARLKSLVRLKSLTDELRLRSKSMSRVSGDDVDASNVDAHGIALYIGSSDEVALKAVSALQSNCDTKVISNPVEAFQYAATGQCQCVLVAGHDKNFDPLRICGELRSIEATRSLPIILIVDNERDPKVLKGLDVGITDFITTPLESKELQARVRTQIRRKRYHDALRNSLTQTLELALVDPLTGLHNRRYLENHLSTLFARSTARKRPLAVMMIDLDHFKKLNDTHGHAAGDAVLKQFSQQLKLAVRDMDLVCRYGGEEFIVIMPDTTEEIATQVAERLLAELGHAQMIIDGEGNTVKVTASVGLTVKNMEDMLPEICLKQADQALYQAKDAGRNRIVSYAA